MLASSSKNEVCVTDCYFLDQLENGFGGIDGISLVAIIMGTMTCTAGYEGIKNAFPHGHLLTMIF